MFGRNKRSQTKEPHRGTTPGAGRKAPRQKRPAESKIFRKRQSPPRRLTPAQKRLEQQKFLEHLAAVDYGLPYETPDEEALVREIYHWDQAEGGGYFIVKKHYRRGVRLPVLTMGWIPSLGQRWGQVKRVYRHLGEGFSTGW
jgi:hypothetical protein